MPKQKWLLKGSLVVCPRYTPETEGVCGTAGGHCTPEKNISQVVIDPQLAAVILTILHLDLHPLGLRFDGRCVDEQNRAISITVR